MSLARKLASNQMRRVFATSNAFLKNRQPLKPVQKTQVKKIVKRSIINLGEKKFGDTVSATQTTIDWAGTAIVPLSDFPQGDADNNSRDGDQIYGISLNYALTIKNNGNGTPALALNVVRLIIFRWKPFFADVAPTVAKIMTYTSTGYAAEGPITHDGRKQFNILVDRRFTVDSVNKPYVLLKGSCKLSKKVQWKAASTTNCAGGLYMFLISDADSGGGANTKPTREHFAIRINYNDS